MEEDRDCDARKCVISESEDLTPKWIGCECGRWFHMYCVNMTEITEHFVCCFCEEYVICFS